MRFFVRRMRAWGTGTWWTKRYAQYSWQHANSASNAKRRTPAKLENMMTTELNPSAELEILLFISSNLILCADLPYSHRQPVPKRGYV